MKKSLTIFAGLVLVLLTLEVRAVTTTIAVSTKGPDLYADNTTPVLVGETYLLVYLKAGSGLQGVLTDSSMENTDNNIIVAKLYAEQGSKCPYSPIVYDSAAYPTDGTWVLVLLDTRKADGSVGGLVAGYTAATLANSKKNANDMSMNSLNGTVVAVGEKPAIPAGTISASPVISAIKPGGTAVTLSIKDFAYNVNYEVQTSTELGASAWVPAKAGVASRLVASALNVQNGELKEDVPVVAGDTARFYRVIAPSK